MKKFITFFLALIICFCTISNAYSFKTDGYDDGAEWKNTEVKLLVNGESNCKVNFGLMKWAFDTETNSVFFCIMFKEPELSSDNQNIGVSLQIENSDPFIVSVNSAESNPDTDKFKFEGALTVNESSGVTCEIRVGIKHGLPSVLNGKIRFYDSDGTLSNVYDFSIDNVEETTVVYSNEADTTALIKATTKEHANTISTKKQTTTKKSKAEKSSEAPNDTKKSTTKKSNKVTKKVKTKTTKPIYTTEEFITNTALINIIETDTTADNAAIAKNIAKGDIYKTITLIAGGTVLVVISFVGTINAGKKKKDQNDPKL